jgi:hypothetical protein
MAKKLLVISNLLLAAFLSYRLFALDTEISYKDTKGQNSSDYGFVDIRRPTLKISGGFGHIFGLKSTVITKVESQLGSGNDLLNELVAGDEVIRVMGIFISGDVRYAIISIFDNKMKKPQTEGRKVGLGDKIKDFSVVSIQPGSVGLGSDASEQIRLKMFKPR